MNMILLTIVTVAAGTIGTGQNDPQLDSTVNNTSIEITQMPIQCDFNSQDGDCNTQ